MQMYMKQFKSNLRQSLLELSRLSKRVIVIVIDISLCILTVWLAFYLRLGEFIVLSGNQLWAVWISITLAIPIFMCMGLYRSIFRYSGWPALLTLIWATGIYGVIYSFVLIFISFDSVPRTIGFIQPILLLIFIGASRFFAKNLLGDQYSKILKYSSIPGVLVYGAGINGIQLVNAMKNSREMRIKGFLDDDYRLHGNTISGLTIYNPANLAMLVEKLSINKVLLAIPNISRKRRNEILDFIQLAHVSVATLPRMLDLAQGKVNFSDIRDLDIDDLLGRESVIPDNTLLYKDIQGKVVMVTGAGGSIGSELCRQILLMSPNKILLIEQGEFALYTIHKELDEYNKNPELELIPLLVSVLDNDRIDEIISTWHPNIIYHAAAYKHVPLVEHNPSVGIKNNVFGTVCVAHSAIRNGVSDFVLISTDKAVRPTNLMGASKRLAEMVLQALSAKKNISTNFSIVRFGNVLDSSGSVVPKFREQIKCGGPITLTHPEVTRYFMTIPEAAQLVLQAGAMGNYGDVFLLDMGPPVRIMDLAKKMIELSGLTLISENNPDGDIGIEVTGLRPGEKLYEELLIGNNPQLTKHPRIMRAQEDFIPWSELEDKLTALQIALTKNNVNTIQLLMKEMVSGYVPIDNIVDWVYLKRIKYSA